MYAYFLKAFIDGRYTQAGLFKQQADFNANLPAQLDTILAGHEFRIIACSDGVIVECGDALEGFGGSSFTIHVNAVEIEFRVMKTPMVY
jgi:hypothetical protein